jgi:hypothetical protein
MRMRRGMRRRLEEEGEEIPELFISCNKAIHTWAMMQPGYGNLRAR